MKLLSILFLSAAIFVTLSEAKKGSGGGGGGGKGGGGKGKADTCDGLCGSSYDPNLPCQCNDLCSQYGNCCSDYGDFCLTCQDRCGISYNPSLECQCNSDCLSYGNCCDDWVSLCGGGTTPAPPTTTTPEPGSCAIQLDIASSWPTDPPIITDSNDDFVFPDGSYVADDRVIRVSQGEILKLACSGQLLSSVGVQFAEASCFGNNAFMVDGTVYDFNDLGCTDQPEYQTNELVGQTCGPANEGTQIQIGFVTEAEFEESIRVCFDVNQSRVIWSRHIEQEELEARDTSNDRPSFRNEGWFPFDVNDAYTQVSQTAVIDDLTGGLGGQYVQTGDDVYLARGHLAPNADFVYYALQDSTFYFINVAPQWQCFNGKGWAQLEDEIRGFTIERQIDIEIHTGTHGILALPDSNGVDVQIFLHPEDGRLPVPNYYWKTLVDPISDTGVAIIGVNNPHQSAADAAERLCTPIDHPLIDGVSNPTDPVDGIIYACTIQDAKAVIEEIPEVGGAQGVLM